MKKHLSDRLNTVLGMLSNSKDAGRLQHPLSSLEAKLFDSMEFCLSLLGALPMPTFAVTKDGTVISLSLGAKGDDSSPLYCAHLPQGVIDAGKWKVSSPASEDCIFCSAAAKALKSKEKVNIKGEWLVSQGPGKPPKPLVVSIHAVPTTIKDERLVIVAVEDNTELERLKGLLPICMECNKIHDSESGKWVRVDQYVSDHSPAKFSHGLCPQCSERLLKEIED